MSAIEVTAWLAAGYGVVLLCVAYGIDRLAKRAQTSVQESRTPGFRYHEDHDAWMCPEDQWLWPQSYDPDNRVMRYRGSPSVCNSCPVKDTCTSSDDGREMRRMVDAWPASEAARFHRGIACSVVVIAMVWPLAGTFMVEGWESQVLLLAVMALVAVGSWPLWAHLRNSPADPHGVLVKSLDENVEDRRVAAEALERRRTSYRSDRREADRA